MDQGKTQDGFGDLPSLYVYALELMCLYMCIYLCMCSEREKEREIWEEGCVIQIGRKKP